MKEQVMETAGKTWKFLGLNGETQVTDLAKRMREPREVVYQSLGWLAREDKISYYIREDKTFVSLNEIEKQAFQSAFQGIEQSLTESPKIRRKGRSAKTRL